MSCNWNRSLVLLVSLSAFAPVGCASLDSFTGAGGSDSVAKASLKEDVDEKFARARTLERSGDWDKAAKIYEDLLKEDDSDWRLHHRAAVAADNQKRFKLAQTRYTRAIQLNPKNAQLFNDLGYCFYLQGQLEKAESAMGKAVQLAPDSSRYRNNYGMVLGHQERIEEAFEQFAKAGSEADAFYNVAFIYASNDNDKAAMECFELALESDPTHDKARNAMESFARDDRGESIMPTEGQLVRYDEGDSPFDASAADFEASVPDNRSAGAATRQLHQRARKSLDQRLSSQRNKTAGE